MAWACTVRVCKGWVRSSPRPFKGRGELRNLFVFWGAGNCAPGIGPERGPVVEEESWRWVSSWMV
ncbi:hypothetical protein GCM10010372_63140 [Streptomyces tauricus]|nr:hypothetical protein GCM10010372_63140 [Streptomyces tauricus]